MARSDLKLAPRPILTVAGDYVSGDIWNRIRSGFFPILFGKESNMMSAGFLLLCVLVPLVVIVIAVILLGVWMLSRRGA